MGHARILRYGGATKGCKWLSNKYFYADLGDILKNQSVSVRRCRQLADGDQNVNYPFIFNSNR
jgi:hypothetical protein